MPGSDKAAGLDSRAAGSPVPNARKTGKAKGPKTAKGRRQVAALPVCLDVEGRLRVLLETSRETGRFIIPKGWTERGMKDWQVAALEAKEEAGLRGRISKKPIGEYMSWKRLPDHFSQVKVKVFVLEAERQMAVWKEKGQRKLAWFLIEDAIKLVDEPGMVSLLQELPTKKLKAQPLWTSHTRKKPLFKKPKGDIGTKPSKQALAAAQDLIGSLEIGPDGSPLFEVIAACWLAAEAEPTTAARASAADQAKKVLAQIVQIARTPR